MAAGIKAVTRMSDVGPKQLTSGLLRGHEEGRRFRSSADIIKQSHDKIQRPAVMNH